MTDGLRPLAILVHATIPQDQRVAKQAGALAEAGHEVDVFGLRDPEQTPEETMGTIRLKRLPMRRRWHGMGGHMLEYGAFAALATVALASEHRRRRYGLVQVAAPPDFLVAAAIPVRALGVPVLIDLHEDMPAFFGDRFRTPALRALNPVVEAVSRASAAGADHVLTVHHGVREMTIRRGVPPERVDVVMNGADSRVFDPDRFPHRPFMHDGDLRLMHHSALQPQYGADVAVEAIARLRDRVRVRLDIYGEGPFRPAVERAIDTFRVGDLVSLHGRLPLHELPPLIAGCDIGLVPTRPEPYAELLLSTKLLEYAAMGKPVIASDLATYRDHVTPEAVRYVRGGDASALAGAVMELVSDPQGAGRMGEQARSQVTPYAWEIQAQRYVEVIRRLLDARSARA